MKSKRTKSLERVMADDAAITAALARGVREALRRHQRAGIPAVEWRGGKIVRVPPKQLATNGVRRVRKPGSRTRKP